MMARRQSSPEEQLVKGMLTVIGGLFRGIWLVISLPWRKNKLSKRTNRVVIDKELVKKRWSEINLMADAGGESRLRTAIVEADKLLDYALRGKGLPGETTAEKLKAGRQVFSHGGYEAAWSGHKLRNRIVHEISDDVLHWEVKDGLKNFERALKELGAL